MSKSVFERVGQLFTLSNSKFGTRIFAVTTLSLGLAGIALPFVPVAAPAILIAGLASVAVGVIADTLQVRNIMGLQKEHTLLKKAQGSQLAQDKILEQHPELKNILASKLSTPARNNEKSITERYNDPNSPRSWLSKATDASAALNNNFGIISAFVKSANKEDQKSFIEDLATAFYSLVSGKERKTQTKSVRDILESQIDDLRGQKNTPGYNNLSKLKNSVHEQRIQQIALMKLTEHPKYAGMIELTKHVSPQDRKGLETALQKKFAELKEEVASKEKTVSNRPILSGITSMAKAAAKAHNPFSQYYDLNAGKVKISQLNPKTHQVEKIQVKTLEKAKEAEKKAEKKAKKEAKFDKKVGKIAKAIVTVMDKNASKDKHKSRFKSHKKSENKSNNGHRNKKSSGKSRGV